MKKLQFKLCSHTEKRKKPPQVQLCLQECLSGLHPIFPSSSNSPISAISQDQCNHRAQQIELKWLVRLSASYRDAVSPKKEQPSRWAVLDFCPTDDGKFLKESNDMSKTHTALWFRVTPFWFFRGFTLYLLTLKLPTQCNQARHCFFSFFSVAEWTEHFHTVTN